MTCFDSDRPKGPMSADAFRAEADCHPSTALPGTALCTLDRIAEALGIATALLRPHPRSGPCDGPDSWSAGRSAGLMEASALLQAFIRIEDPETRRRCLALVRAASAEGGNA